jgi:hypothetical protein
MADLDTELHLLGEAEVRLALIRRQIEDVEGLIEQTHDARILNSYRRTLKLLIRTQQAFTDHRITLLDSVGRLQRQDSAFPPESFATPTPLSATGGSPGSLQKWEQW